MNNWLSSFFEHITTTSDLTIIEVSLVSLITGLLVLFVAYITNNVWKLIKYCFKRFVLQPLKEKKEKREYETRLKEGKLSVNEYISFAKKVENGKATELETDAFEKYRELHVTSVSSKYKNMNIGDQVQETLKKVHDELNNSHK